MMGLKILILACVLVTPAGAAPRLRYRCLTKPESVERDFKGSAAVFLGEVVRVRMTGGLREARLKVSRAWKGVETEEVTVFEPANSAESPHYQEGVSYLVFAGTRDGRLFTGACSRTKPERSAQRDLRQLGEGREPKSGRG